MSRNHANMLVAISLVTLAAVQHYCVRYNVYVERRLLQLRGYNGQRKKSIVDVSELQFSDERYTEVLL
jgi:hypothetical protein